MQKDNQNNYELNTKLTSAKNKPLNTLVNYVSLYLYL